MKFTHLRALTLIFAALSCSGNKGGGAAGGTDPVREYQVIVIKPKAVTLSRDYPTTIQGRQTIEIRPRVTGYIEEIRVDEGDFVKKGQVLFRLNANDLIATVRSGEAQVKVAEAEVVDAKINLGKTRPLVEKDIISKFELESAESSLQVKEAQLAQAKADLENARANLQYAIISSPVDGIIGTFPYKAGSLVTITTTLPLTTVSNTSHMYAYFSINEKEFVSLIKDLHGKTLQEKLGRMPKVSLVLADNTVYPDQGQIETASGIVDTETGAVNVRATFPNAEGLLRSGGSGVVRIPQHLDSALIVPQSATYDLQDKHFVYVVGKDKKVHSKDIKVLSGNLKDSYVVTDGLKNGDQIVIEGIGSLRDSVLIKPKIVEAGKNATEKNAPEISLQN